VPQSHGRNPVVRGLLEFDECVRLLLGRQLNNALAHRREVEQSFFFKCNEAVEKIPMIKKEAKLGVPKWYLDRDRLLYAKYGRRIFYKFFDVPFSPGSTDRLNGHSERYHRRVIRARP